MSVAAFSGIPMEDSYREGPASDILAIDGYEAACGAQNIRMVTKWAATGGEGSAYGELWKGARRARDYTASRRSTIDVDDPSTFDKASTVRAGWYGEGPGNVTYNAAVAHGCMTEDGQTLYDAKGRGRITLGHGDPHYGIPNFQLQSGVGLLSGFEGFVHNDFCSGFFSGTPPNLTWNNHIVRTSWSLVWVIASLVLLVVMVVQGIRLIYEMWLDPGRAVGISEVIPRILASVVLASLSLWLCQVVMVLVKDLTCYVAEATGTSFWSVLATVGQVLLAMLEWIGFWLGAAAIASAVAPGVGQAAVIVGAVILLIIILMLLIMIMIVFFHMLLRTFLLGILIVFAPAAMIMFASDQTEKWTKRWVSMFFGTLFQQVVVLVILYVGKAIFLGDASLSGGAVTGADGVNFTESMFGLLGLLLVTYLAVKAPKIVNPEGSGVFSGFAQLLQMATMATMVVATAAVGAIAGGVGALGAAGGAAGGSAGAGAGAPGAATAGSGSAGAVSTAGGTGPQAGWGGQMGSGARQAGSVTPTGGSGGAEAVSGDASTTTGPSAPTGGEASASSPPPSVNSGTPGTSGSGGAQSARSGFDRFRENVGRVARGAYEGGRAELQQPHSGGVRGVQQVYQAANRSRRSQGERQSWRDVADQAGL